MPRESKRPRVLVADDVLSMAETVADGLCDHGFEAIAVGSGDAAARRLREEDFDALVTDLRMPKVDGLELLRIARRRAPDMPVLVMTAYGAVDSAVEAIRLGAYH
ncbi:MAG TPA: response regulator, partial [Minicystis sp.]|nr:response regulator [Minicystis sp.]